MNKGVLASLVIGAAFFGMVAVPATAVDEESVVGPTHHLVYGVPDWRAIATARSVEFKTYRTIVLSNSSYSDEEKAAKVAAKYSAIEQAVRDERRVAYAAVTKIVAVGNSCTNKGGSPKKCDPKCVGAPLPGMYTSLAWTEGWWGGDVDPASLKPNANKMGDDRVQGDSLVCAGRLKQSGKGRKTSYAEGAFRIRPARIEAIVAEELIPLMKIVAITPI